MLPGRPKARTEPALHAADEFRISLICSRFGSDYFFRTTVTKNAPHRSLPSASVNHVFSLVFPAGSLAVRMTLVVFGSALVNTFTLAT